MGKPFKVVNIADTGTATKFGANDLDNIAAFLNAQSDVEFYGYFVYLESGTYKAKNGVTQAVDYSNAALHTVINSILGAMSSTAYVDICIDKGLHSVTAQITQGSKSNFQIRGLGKGITVLQRSSSFPDADMFFFYGTLDGTVNYAIASDCLAQTDVVTVTTAQSANFAIGDRIKLVSTGFFHEADQQGEYNRIINIDTGTGELFLETFVAADYLTSDSAKVIKFNPIKNVTLKDFSVTSAQNVVTQADYKAVFNIRKAVNLNIDNIRVFDEASRSFQLLDCVGFTVKNCSFENKLLIGTGSNTINYNIEIGGASCNGVVSGNRGLWGGRHFFTTTSNSGGSGIDNHGISRNIVVSGNSVHGNGPEAAFDTHGCCESILFTGNVIRGDRTATNDLISGWFAGWNGFQIRGKRNQVIGNTIFNAYNRAIQIDGDDIVASNNTIINIINSGSNAIGGANSRNRAIIDNNIIYSAKKAIDLPTGFDNAVVTNNKIYDCTDAAITITDCDAVTISGNITNNNNSGLILGGTTDNCFITNNDFANNTNTPTLTGTTNIFSNNTGITLEQYTVFNPSTGTDNEDGTMTFKQKNASGTVKTIARLAAVYDDDVAGTEDGRMYLTLIEGGTENYAYEFGPDGISIDEAHNIILGSATGTKIGTATTQKLGFFNATPIAQPAANADTSGAILSALETEVNQIKQLLRDLGLMAT